MSRPTKYPRGVSPTKHGRWRARACVERGQRYIGVFATQAEAFAAVVAEEQRCRK